MAAPVTPRGITAQRGRTVHESGAYSRTMAQMVDRWVARALRNRRLVRSPIWLYRHGLGWLLGPRVLMLEHVGRKTGEPRYVCLEVVQREGSTPSSWSAALANVRSGIGTWLPTQTAS